MVMELSADTYDWDRIGTLGSRLVDALEQISKIDPQDDVEQYAEAVWHALEDEAGVDPLVYTDSSTVLHDGDSSGDIPTSATVKYPAEYPGNEQDWHTYNLLIRLTPGNLPFVRFSVTPDFSDDKSLYEGYLSDDFNSDSVRRHITYLFETCRKAICDLSPNTLLSERESEVFLLKQEGYSDEELSELTGLTKSNITTYKTRIRDRLDEAEAQLETAERTVETLSGSWVSP